MELSAFQLVGLTMVALGVIVYQAIAILNLSKTVRKRARFTSEQLNPCSRYVKIKSEDSELEDEELPVIDFSRGGLSFKLFNVHEGFSFTKDVILEINVDGRTLEKAAKLIYIGFIRDGNYFRVGVDFKEVLGNEDFIKCLKNREVEKQDLYLAS